VTQLIENVGRSTANRTLLIRFGGGGFTTKLLTNVLEAEDRIEPTCQVYETCELPILYSAMELGAGFDTCILVSLPVKDVGQSVVYDGTFASIFNDI
jgi:adenosyl cobinamide kinase/adenosyl cobinamide phosphate guanylyltransferase